jgi:4-amino-4-deoxy-L-arabinose transferase-like glycosyltransferase
MEPAQSISRSFKMVTRGVGTLMLSKETVFIFTCAIFAFLLRLFLLPQEPILHNDGAHYLALGKKIISGDLAGGIHAYWPPLYPFLIGLTSLFTDEFEFAGRLVSIASGSLLVVPTYFLIREFYGRVPAYYGTTLIAIHPSLIESSGWVLTESLYTLIFTTVVLIGWRALKHGRTRTFFVTGLLLGAAYITKPEAIAFMGLFLLLAVATTFFHRNHSFRSFALGYLFLFIGFTIFLFPYVVVINHKTGQWTFSQKLVGNITSVNYKTGNLELTDDGLTTRIDQLVGTDYLENTQIEKSAEIAPVQAPNPLAGANFDFAKLLSATQRNLKKEVREHIPTILPYSLILLALVGLFHEPWNIFRTAKELYLFSFLAATLIGYAVSVVELRYLFPIVPLLICSASFGIVAFSRWASKSFRNSVRTKRKLDPLLLQIFVLLIVVSPWIAPLVVSQPRSDQILASPEKRVGLWIKSHKTTESLVMAASPKIAYYAEEKHIYLPNEDFLSVLEYAKRKRVAYLIIDWGNLRKTPEFLVPEEPFLPPEFKLVFTDKNGPENEISVYQLLNQQ